MDLKNKIKTIKIKYPDRVPIFVNKVKNSTAPDIDKHKYLVPIDLTLGQFIYVIRKRMKISPEQAIFIFCNEILPPTSILMGDLYKTYSDKDDLLNLTYNLENTFGTIPPLLSFLNKLYYPKYNINYNFNPISINHYIYDNKFLLNNINNINNINNNLLYTSSNKKNTSVQYNYYNNNHDNHNNHDNNNSFEILNLTNESENHYLSDNDSENIDFSDTDSEILDLPLPKKFLKL